MVTQLNRKHMEALDLSSIISTDERATQIRQIASRDRVPVTIGLSVEVGNGPYPVGLLQFIVSYSRVSYSTECIPQFPKPRDTNRDKNNLLGRGARHMFGPAITIQNNLKVLQNGSPTDSCLLGL